MSDGSNQPFDPRSAEDRGRLRMDAAGLIKAFILARIRAEPDFLSVEERGTWWRAVAGDLMPDFAGWTALRLLQDASQMNARFRQQYEGFGQSIAAPEPGPEEIVENLRVLVLEFAVKEQVSATIQQLRDAQPANWTAIANWGQLPQIRRLLDQIPRPNGNNQDDGPFGINGFRFEGREANGLQPTAWRLVNFLWSRKNRSATFQELAGPVWGDHELAVDSITFGSARSDANKFFHENNFPFKVMKRRGEDVAFLIDSRNSNTADSVG